MNEVYRRILKMRHEQEASAGLFFAEFSTPATWRELLDWLVQNPSEDFQEQMTEIAALAVWALETCEADRLAETTVSDCPPYSQQAIHRRFGPIDQPLRGQRRKKIS